MPLASDEAAGQAGGAARARPKGEPAAAAAGRGLVLRRWRERDRSHDRGRIEEPPRSASLPWVTAAQWGGRRGVRRGGGCLAAGAESVQRAWPRVGSFKGSDGGNGSLREDTPCERRGYKEMGAEEGPQQRGFRPSPWARGADVGRGGGRYVFGTRQAANNSTSGVGWGLGREDESGGKSLRHGAGAGRRNRRAAQRTVERSRGQEQCVCVCVLSVGDRYRGIAGVSREPPGVDAPGMGRWGWRNGWAQPVASLVVEEQLALQLIQDGHLLRAERRAREGSGSPPSPCRRQGSDSPPRGRGAPLGAPGCNPRPARIGTRTMGVGHRGRGRG